MGADKVHKLAVVSVSLFVLSGCGGVETPRWASTQPPGETDVVAESPRQTVVVSSSPDVGLLVLSGIVISDSSTAVQASGPGRVSSGDVSPGEPIALADPLLVFTPALTAEQVLERQILTLEGELALEQGDVERGDEVAVALADLSAAHEALAEEVFSPIAGVISGIRPNLDYEVDAGETLFIVSDPDVVVVRVTSVAVASPLSVGDRVSVALEHGERTSGHVRMVEDRGDGSTAEIEVDDFAEPGQLVDVELAIVADSGANEIWIPAEALHRANGASFILIEGDGGALDRSSVRLGRRTESHVEITPDSEGRVPLVVGDVLVLP